MTVATRLKPSEKAGLFQATDRAQSFLIRELLQTVHNPDHPLRILTAVPLKLLAHLAAFSLRHVAAMNAQAPKITGRLPVVPNLAHEN